MKLEFAPGKYVVAVSGGVDSVVLLDLAAKLPNVKSVVAHFDHGIRSESGEDRKFVENLAKKYGLEFIFAEGKLGANASEALAREKRYEFLNRVREERGASAIITAHHQDDLLETAIINLLRGTNRRGLSALKSTDVIKRPLLNYSKQEIKNYAMKNSLVWREDSTNLSDKYLRNYVRHQILPKIDREKLLNIVSKAARQNNEIDQLLTDVLDATGNKLNRPWLNSLPDNVAREVMAAWLRSNGVSNYDKKALERLVTAARTARNNTKHNVIQDAYIITGRNELALAKFER